MGFWGFGVFVAHANEVHLLLSVQHRVSLLVGMLYHLLNIARIQRIENVPEVLSVWDAVFWQLRRKVHEELAVILHHGPKLYHR